MFIKLSHLRRFRRFLSTPPFGRRLLFRPRLLALCEIRLVAPFFQRMGYRRPLPRTQMAAQDVLGDHVQHRVAVLLRIVFHAIRFLELVPGQLRRVVPVAAIQNLALV